jgi:hypothetical protein
LRSRLYYWERSTMRPSKSLGKSGPFNSLSPQGPFISAPFAF